MKTVEVPISGFNIAHLFAPGVRCALHDRFGAKIGTLTGARFDGRQTLGAFEVGDDEDLGKESVTAFACQPGRVSLV